MQGHRFRAGPRRADATPYYYPGGRVAGPGVPAGWYSEPWWKTALVAGAWGFGWLLVFDALFSPAWGGGGYDAGYDAGFDQGYDAGNDAGPGRRLRRGGRRGDRRRRRRRRDFGDAGGDFGGGDFGGGDF